MDNLMKLVVTALEWSYLDGKTDVAPSRLKSAAELAKSSSNLYFCDSSLRN